MVTMSKAQMDAQARKALLMGVQQWNDMMLMARTCPYVRGFSYVSPDSIVLQISDKCPWMKFHERLQKTEVA